MTFNLMRKYLLILFLAFSSAAVFGQSKEGIAVMSQTEMKKVTISPNPAVADILLTIEGNMANVRSISIYSIIGSEVFAKQYDTPSNNFKLDVRSLKKGKYMVRVLFEDNTSEVATLIKQ